MSCLARPPHVESQRLRLRGVRRGDLPRLAELANDPGVARMTSSMPHPYGLADAEGFFEASRLNDPGRAALFVVEHDGAAIGTLGFRPGHLGRCEVGYWLGRPYWGRGLATEALKSALAWARGDWRRKLVVAGHFADNPASGQVLVKAGFLYTGEVLMRASKARGEAALTRMMVWLA